MNGYSFHPEAELDLEETWDFISADNVAAADKIIYEILAVIQKAVETPFMGHHRPGLTSKSIRLLHVNEYIIAYIPDRQPLPILAVLHGRRNPRVLAAILRDRRM